MLVSTRNYHLEIACSSTNIFQAPQLGFQIAEPGAEYNFDMFLQLLCENAIPP
jgi:hypothetical protein